ncbi:MAG: hypothetical protein U0Z53_00175 [Blastocatellia bacterium]
MELTGERGQKTKEPVTLDDATRLLQVLRQAYSLDREVQLEDLLEQARSMSSTG